MARGDSHTMVAEYDDDNIDVRTPKERWHRPRAEVLMGERYPQDEPPFDPFPTVQNIKNAVFCPVAALHDLLYGYGNATISGGGYGVGELFHQYIAYLKNMIARGELHPDAAETEILFRFEDYARYMDSKTKRACQLYIEPWLDKRLGELKDIQKNAKIFFEVFIANAFVPFNYRNRITSYPVYGKIDELDFERKRIVERTISGDREEKTPPLLKDFQIWLLWKTLSCIENKQFPKQWRDVNFDEFDLIVETPYENFLIDKDNPKFEEKVHEAFAWISDISKERRATWEAWEHRACTINDQKECGLSYFCYGRRRTYPTSRREFRQRVGIFFRPLFWEQMWEHHLFKYQLTMLPERAVKDKLRKYVTGGKIVQEEERNITLELDGAIAPVLERHIKGDDSCKMVFGSFNIGIEREARIKDVDEENKKIEVVIDKRGLSPHGSVQILFPETSMIKESPWFLRRLIQRELYKLEKWGIDIPNKAAGKSVIQMIECLFGSNTLKMEGEREEKRNNR